MIGMKYTTLPCLVSSTVPRLLGALGVCLMVAGGAIVVSFTLQNIPKSYAAEALSPATTALFAAVRGGDLSGVQAALVDGADLSAVNQNNINAEALARSYNYYTIAYFLKTYSKIEGNGAGEKQQQAAAPKMAEPVSNEPVADEPVDIPDGQYSDGAGKIFQNLTQKDDMAGDPPISPAKPTALLKALGDQEPADTTARATGSQAGSVAEEADFFAQMRAFGETPLDPPAAGKDPPAVASGLDDGLDGGPGDGPAKNLVSRLGSTELSAPADTPLGRVLPKHESLRNAVLENLQRESKARLAELENARDEIADRLILEERAKLHGSGTQNVQSDFRAKKRAEMTGDVLPPGYVPPPDGGRSGVRFLQRLGLYGNDENAQPVPMESEVVAGQLKAALGEDRFKAFLKSGYSAPPAGQTIDTTRDSAIATIAQMTRMFSPVPGNSGLHNRPQTKVPISALSRSPASGPVIDALSGRTGTGQVIASAAPLQPGVPSELQALPQGIMEGITRPTTVPLRPIVPPVAPYPLTDKTWDVNATMGGLSETAQETGPGSETDTGEDTPIIDILADVFGPKSREKPVEAPSPLEKGGSWDVVAVKLGPSQNRLPADQSLGSGRYRSAGTAVTPLVMGQSVALGKSSPVALNPSAAEESCITKHQSAVTFCIEQIDWPDELKDAIWVDTVMYQGLNAIVRYDNGVATRFHSLFPSASFARIVEYYISTLGPPHSTWNRSISALAAPKHDNPTVTWKALNPYTQVVTILEIRQFDDTRGGFPDNRRGAIMLHNAQSGTIFPQVSAFELMRLRPL